MSTCCQFQPLLFPIILVASDLTNTAYQLPPSGTMPSGHQKISLEQPVCHAMSYQLQLLLFSENDLKLSFAYIRSSPNFVSYIYTLFSPVV